ncbi:AAEL009251-PA [Aedes aegypti]|uniref:Uncharacterized protein n=2 Tax=Aedes aegypti TaxID=7159 RepID=A0A8W7ISS6_AEDAE|nr:salivary glue protein Sgs-3 isoform X1 [Aedes aegypti]XP_021697139.1 salivary glue protein Sgs-3 isoform X1 [Aedes aegypti]XP_021697145.1 salivary glue protein Sgs-3 isoform X1 [Aedes aegypti]EAT38903.1 AAEL009251-PA [Aedes aegypti]
MKPFSWSTSVLVVLCLGACALAAPSSNVRVKRADTELSDVELVGAEDASLSNDLDRDKRKIPDPKFEAKNAILGFVFGASKQSGAQASQAVKDAINPTRPPPTSTTDDTPDFNRQKVSLQVPDAVFGSSFSLITNISTQFGNLIMNSARRAGQFLWIVQPLIGKQLTIEVPTTTTTTPRTTTTTRATTTSTTTSSTTTTLRASTSTFTVVSSRADTNEIK